MTEPTVVISLDLELSWGSFDLSFDEGLLKMARWTHVQTVEASRLLGASSIVTGLSPEIAQTLVNIGVDLGKMNTVGDLQGGIEQAERLLGYKVVPLAEAN